MNKRNKVVAVVSVLCLMAGSAVAAGSVTTKMIEAQYMGISLVVDGSVVTPKDASGQTVEPFIYNGTTYLPVRAVGEAMGKTVEWDQNTKTVYVGPRPGAGTDLATLPPYQMSNWVGVVDGKTMHKSFNVAGKVQSLGIQVITGYGENKPHALWNLEGKYQTLTLTAGHVDGTSERNAIISFYLNGSSDAISYDLNWSDLPKSITLSLNGATSLKMEVSATGEGYSTPAYGFYDIKFN